MMSELYFVDQIVKQIEMLLPGMLPSERAKAIAALSEHLADMVEEYQEEENEE